jgi:hypothetical protein
MDLSSGNSGSHLANAIVKTGPGCAQEGAYCEHLGAKVCPRIYGYVPNGYVMEKLEIPWRHPRFLKAIEHVCQQGIWTRPVLPVSNDITWQEGLAKFGVIVPQWVEGKSSLCHGDPTASNLLMRGTGGHYILCDPRAPREFVPQWIQTDWGVILQSYFGWEEIVYQWEKVAYEEPVFMQVPEYRKQAMFWLGAKAARIMHYENLRSDPRSQVLDWCKKIRSMTDV